MGPEASWPRCRILAASLLLATPDAFACSRPVETMSRAQVESYARARYATASSVIDAEVEQPMAFGPELKSGLMPMAILRVIRRYKGVGTPGDDRIALAYFSSCDISLLRKNERVRILLAGGPELFRSDQAANGPAADREESQQEFNAEIDRLVGTPRPTGFSTYPGELDPDADYPEAISGNVAVTQAIPLPKPVSRPGKAKTGIGVYAAGALAVLLAFVIGLLVGRRRKPAAG